MLVKKLRVALTAMPEIARMRCPCLRLGAGSVRIGLERVLETSAVHGSGGHSRPQRILCQAKMVLSYEVPTMERTERAGIINFLARQEVSFASQASPACFPSQPTRYTARWEIPTRR